MTSAEFKAARNELGLTQAQLAEILDTAPPTIRKWEAPTGRSTARGPNPVACRAMRWMLAGFRPPEWPRARRKTDAESRNSPERHSGQG
ncbi:helix-turn-helix domain-containing protein [Pikeienuella sp. HZG-20]|uniref:helix-turn-helix domain-containing protein n=1 Tax=Paludibacillus litoralis TaxID=3133267 RepID=UPI0030EE79E1